MAGVFWIIKDGVNSCQEDIFRGEREEREKKGEAGTQQKHLSLNSILVCFNFYS